MAAETFGYAIRKDVHNYAIHREVDQTRLREMWRLLAAAGVVVALVLFSAYQHFELLRHGYRLEQMQKERAAEAEINRHLRLEIETLRSPGRIEQLAREQLGMVSPGPGDAVVIERVLPSAPPPSSVVASR